MSVITHNTNFVIETGMKACIEQLDRIQKRALKVIDRNAHKDLKYIALECMYIFDTSECQKKTAAFIIDVLAK